MDGRVRVRRGKSGDSRAKWVAKCAMWYVRVTYRGLYTGLLQDCRLRHAAHLTRDFFMRQHCAFLQPFTRHNLDLRRPIVVSMPRLQPQVQSQSHLTIGEPST